MPKSLEKTQNHEPTNVKNILIFPASLAESVSLAEAASARGDFVVGAASVTVPDEERRHFSRWEELPFITDPGFEPALAQLLHRHGITAIHAPHPVVWTTLRALLPKHHPEISLLNDNPVEQRLLPLRRAEQQRDTLPFQLTGLTTTVASFPPWLGTALTLALQHLPGQSPAEKLSLMAGLVHEGVTGDIIEIGSLWGRSAYALAQACTQEGIGPVLCIDPWQSSAYQQPDSDPLLAVASDTLDAETSYRYFVANMAPFAGVRCNYFRGYSTEAAEIYRSRREIHSECYGSTRYSGRIALLHIDGNHDYAAVVADLTAWAPLLQPGGWLILDDYCWPFGDGPRRAADEWCLQHVDHIECAFCAFGSLWLRLKT